jgi:hypothetical protein
MPQKCLGCAGELASGQAVIEVPLAKQRGASRRHANDSDCASVLRAYQTRGVPHPAQDPTADNDEEAWVWT